MNSAIDSIHPSGTASAAPGRGRRLVFASLAAVIALQFVLYFPTYASMVGIWLRSDTFLHGILILPISAWLVWRRWPHLQRVPVAPALAGILAVPVLSLLWWISDAAGIQVGAQLATVGMIPALVLAVAGTRFAHAIAFPLAYLVFAVPFGEGAIPYLIDFTATFTVEALQLTGFPVLREGAYFSIPAGNFEVAKACSGIRYLLASLALGTLYGYLIFNSLKKRLLFFLVALILPIVANGLRAYAIVLIAHFSDMRLAVGVDHIIFGWIFFGLVMLLMYFIGDYFRDRPEAETDVDATPVPTGDAETASRAVALAGLSTALLLFVGPALAMGTTGLAQPGGMAMLPIEIGDAWQVSHADDDSGWQPQYVAASHAAQRRYESDRGIVDLAIVRYDGVAHGAELTNPENIVADPGNWRLRASAVRTLELAGQANRLTVREVLLQTDVETRLLLVWHEVDRQPVSGHVETKWREILSLARLQPPVSGAFLVSAPITRDLDDVRERLETFISTGWGQFQRCMYSDAAQADDCLAGSNEFDTAGADS